MVLGLIGFGSFVSLTSSSSMTGEAALGWLVVFPVVTLGALLLGVLGLVLLVLGLVLKSR